MAGKKGFGAKLEYESGAGPVYTAIANITKIRPFAQKADSIDVTAHDSADSYREKISGLLDSGQATFDLNYDDTNTGHAWLSSNLGTVKSFKVTFSGSTPKTATFSGFVSGVTPELPHDNKQTCSCTIEITGKVTIA